MSKMHYFSNKFSKIAKLNIGEAQFKKSLIFNIGDLKFHDLAK